MPLETFTGPHLPTLLARARAALGADAVVVSVQPATPGGRDLQLVAADPATVAVEHLPAQPRRRTGGAQRPEYQPEPGEQLVIALVGPTGAGKTTTIAKLATHPEAYGRRKVGLLCLDTYRIGAVEQSRIYADLGGLPFEVAHEVNDLDAALRRLRQCEVLLVDTAGRGPRNAADNAVTERFLRRLRPAEIHLVLQAGLRPEVARRLVAEYRRRPVTHLLPTKLDEFPDDVTLFPLAVETGLPARWFTNGQDVPFDLGLAAPFVARARQQVAPMAAGAGSR
jgi:flagellar biosynthesis protein FlhF